MTIHFNYNKKQVIQALRYHFITRPELRSMIILVNVFVLVSAGLFYFKLISSFAFMAGSAMWFIMMVIFWFILPGIVYSRTATFKDSFTMKFEEESFLLGNERGSRSWPWKSLSKLAESPHFFYLYFDSRSFFLIPKSGCKDSDEIFELRKLLNAKVKK